MLTCVCSYTYDTHVKSLNAVMKDSNLKILMKMRNVLSAQ